MDVLYSRADSSHTDKDVVVTKKILREILNCVGERCGEEECLAKILRWHVLAQNDLSNLRLSDGGAEWRVWTVSFYMEVVVANSSMRHDRGINKIVKVKS